MSTPHDMNRMYDVVVIGGGPAGLTAALYLARARYRVLVVEKEHFGGQITITNEVVNYPGVLHTSGTALTETMRQQAESFGAEFLFAETTSLDMDGDIKKVHTSKGVLECFGVLLATGAKPRIMGFKGESEFRGRGVAYCATCDGEFYTGKKVFVVGGGFAAAEESVFLTKYATDVTILIREPDFTCAKAVADAARSNEKITVITNVEVEELSGEKALTKIRYRNNQTGEITEYESPNGENFGVFIFAGYEPATELVKQIADLDSFGYVITDNNKQTKVEGLYAAGDVCIKPLRQVVTAVGDGALAATELEKYALSMHEKTGIKPNVPTSKPVEKPSVPQDEASGEGGIFDSAMLGQLNTVFSKMQGKLTLKLALLDNAVSKELEEYIDELAKLTDKLTIEKLNGGENAPFVEIYRENGESTGIAFHGVPGGHEFTSFVLGLYNAAGPGQQIDDEVLQKLRAINKPVDIKILVSLSCTICTELVIAAQRIAAESKAVTAHVFDINHFPDLRDKYNVMSVPCLVIDDSKISFGKRDIAQLYDMIME